MARLGGQNHRRRRLMGQITFGLCLVLAVIIFFAGQADDEVLSDTRALAEDTASPVMTYLSMPLRGFENVLSDLRERTEVHKENQRLQAELSRLTDIEARANALTIKLSRLETILNVDKAYGIPEQKIAARAVIESNGPFVRSVLLNAGANKDIQKGYAVMTVDGLLGHVVRVGNRSARVLRLEDLNSRISVMSVRSQSRAIMTGDNSSRPKLSFITEGSDWAAGDLVITSGDDGILPPGLPVGTLLEEADGQLPVDLYSDDHHVDWVWVYPYNPVLSPEEDPVNEDVTQEAVEVAENDESPTILAEPNE